jgi:hypothetical protein
VSGVDAPTVTEAPASTPKFYTEDDLAKVRSQEKSKLYPEIEQLKNEVASLKKEREEKAARKAEGEAAKAANGATKVEDTKEGTQDESSGGEPQHYTRYIDNTIKQLKAKNVDYTSCRVSKRFRVYLDQLVLELIHSLALASNGIIHASLSDDSQSKTRVTFGERHLKTILYVIYSMAQHDQEEVDKIVKACIDASAKFDEHKNNAKKVNEKAKYDKLTEEEKKKLEEEKERAKREQQAKRVASLQKRITTLTQQVSTITTTPVSQ